MKEEAILYKNVEEEDWKKIEGILLHMAINKEESRIAKEGLGEANNEAL